MNSTFLHRIQHVAMLAAVIALTLSLSSCASEESRTRKETETLRTLTTIEDPAELLAGVEDFLKKYPQSRYRISALMLGLEAAAETDPTSTSVLDYAERYIEAYSAQSGAAIAYAFAARIMQAANAWPDKVDEYLEKALAGEGGVRGGDRGRAQIFDIAGFIKGARGNIEEAIRFEEEALELYPDNPTFRVSLAGYLVNAGRLDEAENQLIGPLLQSPDNQAARETFDELASRKVNGSMSVQAYKEAAIGRGADRMLAEAEDPIQEKQNLAVAFAKLGVLTNRALAYAREIEREIGPDSGADTYLAARSAIAQVYLATENYKGALDVLEPVAALASPYAYDFHLTRGTALEELGREEEAINAYLASASAVANPRIMERLEALWEKRYGGERNLEETLETTQGELESWHPTGHFTVPSDWSGRVVLAELFTGSECPPCLASDIAYDGLIAYYPRSAVAVLAYHQHIPGPDPMTNPDSEARMAFYTRNVIRGVPTSIINGRDHSVGGGGRAAAKGRYGIYSWTVERELANAPKVDVNLSGRRSGQGIEVGVTVQVNDPTLLDEGDLKVRVALAEKLIHFEGGNGISEHRMVVRTFIGGHEGYALSDEQMTFNAHSDIEQLESDLLAYLTEWESANPGRFRDSDGFKEKKHEIDEHQLLLVAFVQDDISKKVLQAKVVELE